MKSLPKLLPLVLFTCFAWASAPQAQDNPDATEVLQQKLAQQAQTITELQSRLASCAGEDKADKDESTLSNRYSFQAPAAPAAPRRTVGVYQQPTEPKLTCADYSQHYFSRHPAMAAVCGAGTRSQPPLTEDSSPTTPLPQHP